MKTTFSNEIKSIFKSPFIEVPLFSNNQPYDYSNYRANEFALFMVPVHPGISSRAILNTTDHSSTTESSIRSVPTALPQPPTTSPIVPNPISISLSGLDRSGTTSHSRINPRPPKTRSGIKAVIHNKLKDILPLLLVVLHQSIDDHRATNYGDLLFGFLLIFLIFRILRIMVLLVIPLPTVSTSPPKPAQYPSPS